MSKKMQLISMDGSLYLRTSNIKRVLEVAGKYNIDTDIYMENKSIVIELNLNPLTIKQLVSVLKELKSFCKFLTEEQMYEILDEEYGKKTKYKNENLDKDKKLIHTKGNLSLKIFDIENVLKIISKYDVDAKIYTEEGITKIDIKFTYPFPIKKLFSVLQELKPFCIPGPLENDSF